MTALAGRVMMSMMDVMAAMAAMAAVLSSTGI
jgi:hypothetical protein